MLKTIAIIVSLILGAFAGRIACGIMNKERFTINPVICTIVGVLGGGLGSWLVGSFGFGSTLKTLLIQLVCGIGFAVLLLFFLFLVRDRREDVLEEEDEEDSEEENS